MARIGAVAAAPYLGGQFALMYLGESPVLTLPGRVTIVSAQTVVDPEVGVITTVVFTVAPGVVSGYRFRFEGVLLEPSTLVIDNGIGTAVFDVGATEASLSVAAFNDAGVGAQVLGEVL